MAKRSDGPAGRKINCWEFTGCGRGPGGERVGTLGVCPVAVETGADGIHGGVNGGRVCWTIAGTYCGGKLQGSYAAKLESCLRCEFCQMVLREERAGRDDPGDDAGKS